MIINFLFYCLTRLKQLTLHFFCLLAEFPDRDQLELSKRKSDLNRPFAQTNVNMTSKKIFRSTLLLVDTTVDAFWFELQLEIVSEKLKTIKRRKKNRKENGVCQKSSTTRFSVGLQPQHVRLRRRGFKEERTADDPIMRVANTVSHFVRFSLLLLL